MFRWTMTVALIAILAAIFLFGGVYSRAASFAQVLFIVFLALLVAGLIGSGFRRSSSQRAR